MTAPAPAPAAVVVLAAGGGTRMKSARPKVLHEVAGRSLVGHALATARSVAPERVVVVVGHGRDQVVPHLAELPDGSGAPVVPVVQERQDGTASAVRVALDALDRAGPVEGVVVVTLGDAPLLRGSTLAGLLERHHAEAAAMTLLTAVPPDPAGYGRIVRVGGAPDGPVERIVEQKDATEAERAVREVNAGVYAFDAGALREALGRVRPSAVTGERYLTDVLALVRAAGQPVVAVRADDPDEMLGVNDRAQLATAGRLLRDRVVGEAMRAGVTVVDPATTWIDVGVRLEADATLLPGTQLHGATTVATGAVVGPDSTLTDTEVGAGARVERAVATGAVVGPGATVGPFAYLRPGTRLGADGKVGSYVEVKNAEIGEGSKVPHLSYVGDATIGAHSNIGAASVVVNYDGVHKHRTTIGDHVRIGSDTMLVAPVRIGDGAYTAAGSVVVEDVPPGALAVARGRQRTVEGWVARRRPGSPSAAAAERAERSEGSGAGDPAELAGGGAPHRRDGGD